MTKETPKETPSQTAGPFLHIGLAPEAAGVDGVRSFGQQIVPRDAAGERIRVAGIIRDGTGEPVRDALLEVWQADVTGNYGAGGWGRVVPDFQTGEWAFDTIKPGAVDSAQAPHLTLWIIARGINIGLHTRLYFSDEDNSADPVLTLIPEARRDTVIAQRGQGATYRFDIVLQGEDETVFFDV